jgi:hypothetical protein
MQINPLFYFLCQQQSTETIQKRKVKEKAEKMTV